MTSPKKPRIKNIRREIRRKYLQDLLQINKGKNPTTQQTNGQRLQSVHRKGNRNGLSTYER